ncbi:g9599 [Coccomyxa viridis]|uniref:G9599 protein n=1 Tax=Coccomyxa viridis TaxID=1274662 RepID=A0ABP1G348_9CHLO
MFAAGMGFDMDFSKAALICGVGLCVGLARLSAFKKARTEQIRLAQDLRKRYTLEMQKYLDTLHTYKKRHQPSYYLHWQSAFKPDEDMGSAEKAVETARCILADYWDELLECYESGLLPAKSWIPEWVPRGPFWVPKDMLEPEGNILRKAEDYMRLVEPIDVANWYRLGIHEQTGKDGTAKGDYSSNHPMRPGRYSKIEKYLKRENKEEWHKELDKIVNASKPVAYPGPVKHHDEA